MAITKKPAKEYKLDEWLKKPHAIKDPDKEPFDKYMYQNGESLATIAKTMSRPWNTLSAADIARFNWGASAPSEINYYHERHNGCTQEKNNAYVLAAGDTNPFVWVPRIKVRHHFSKLRNPDLDVGHVAADDVSGTHINTLRIRPAYRLSLNLGDVDAMFDPVNPANPAHSTGVQQRLQVLGYLYTPLGHSQINTHTETVWRYYKKVHTPAGGAEPSDVEALATLKQEVQNNILGRLSGGMLLRKGEMLRGGLPQPGQFAQIRFPGGYCFTFPGAADTRTTNTRWQFQNGNWIPVPPGADGQYLYSLDRSRHDAEDLYFNDNVFLGKIPLVAHVEKVYPGGKIEPAEGVTVYFQLIDPEEIPAWSALRPPELRDHVMDYTKDSGNDPANPGNPIDPPPYIINNRGPKRLIDQAMAGAPNVPNDDPQRDNVDRNFGGKRRVPVHGTPAGANHVPGVFEIGTTRDGVHNNRDDKHANYGDMTAAEEVTPTTESVGGTNVTRHAHAVKATTNDKGNATVVFMPSRIGADRYRLRCYVGPPTLQFAGDTDEGPVVETGTMIVWRNIRMSKYLQVKQVPLADIPANVQSLHPTPPPPMPANANLSAAYNNDGCNTAVEDVDLSSLSTAEAPYNPTFRTFASGAFNSNYRPLQVQFFGLAEQFRRCCCEFIVDCSESPEAVKYPDYVNALTAARNAAQASNEVSVAVNWNALVITPTQDAGDLDKMTSPWTFNVRSFADYNANSGGSPNLNGAARYRQVSNAMVDHAYAAFVRTFNDGGVLPGLTLFQMPHGSTWDQLQPPPTANDSVLTTSGIALSCRGAFLWYSASIYRGNFPYGTSSNAAHELGHVLMRPHSLAAGGERPAQHDVAADAVCVMSYRGCFGEFCGRCVAAIRGWRTRGGVRANGSNETNFL